MTASAAPVRHWFASVVVITVLLQTAIYGTRPMVSYQALSIGASTFELGLIAASFAALSLLVAVPIGQWVDRWGELRFILGGAILISVASIALPWVTTVEGLVCNQALLGLGHVSVVVGTQTLVANWGPSGGRDGRFGVFTVAVSLGQLVGPAGAGFLAGSRGGADRPATASSLGGIDSVFVAAAGLGVLASVVSLTLVVLARRAHRAGGSPRGGEDVADDVSSAARVIEVLRIKGMRPAMLASLTVLTSIDLLATYLPAYGESTGLSVQLVGLLLAARAGASMASRVVMLPLLRWWGRRRLLAASLLLSASAMAVLPFLTTPTWLFGALILMGLGLGLGQPLTLAWIAGRAPPNVRGLAIGVRLSGNRLGQTVLPVAIGALAAASSVAAVFTSLALLLAASTVAVAKAPLDDD